MKKALVTGASEGIGRAFAKKLSQEGFLVTAVARNSVRLQELIKELGVNHDSVVADLTDPVELKKISDLLENGKFDLLINNAGMGVSGGFYKNDLLKQKKMMKLNCDALVELSYRFLKNAKSGDALLNVGSVLSFIALPSSPIYSATKAFVASLTESLWFEQKARGVFVTCLCPGITQTEFQKRAGMENMEFPKAMTQTAEEVVEIAMKALNKRANPIVLCGVKNSLMAAMPRLLSKKFAVTLAGKAR